jgi:hypothetical protein
MIRSGVMKYKLGYFVDKLKRACQRRLTVKEGAWTSAKSCETGTWLLTQDQAWMRAWGDALEMVVRRKRDEADVE